jgi:ABC-2 type transport system ATP-binding protein
MIKVKNVSKFYGAKEAVKDISFEVNKGEVLGFIGPNGAGKSTTMRMLTGFIPISKGEISIGGFNIDDASIDAKKIMGYLPESAPLYSNRTVKEFLNYIAELRGFSGVEKKEKVQLAIKKCFLEPVANQIIETLSKGYKHRTCFAQAILHDPDVLVLDEPTDGLDPNQKREVRKLIKDMGQDKAIIISTHILEEIEAVADRVILISNGEKKFDGTADEFKAISPNGKLEEVFWELTNDNEEV